MLFPNFFSRTEWDSARKNDGNNNCYFVLGRKRTPALCVGDCALEGHTVAVGLYCHITISNICPPLQAGQRWAGAASHTRTDYSPRKFLGNEFRSRALGHFQHHFPSLLLRQCLCVRPISHSSHMEARAHIDAPSHIDDVGYWSPFRRPPQAAAIFVKRVPPRRRRLLNRWDLLGIYFSHLINPRDLFR